MPNYAYLKLKMHGPKGVITIEGSFEQPYYYEQDCVAQAAMLITPYSPDCPGYDAGLASVEEASKMVVVLDRPSIDKAVKTSSGSGGSVSPSI